MAFATPVQKDDPLWIPTSGQEHTDDGQIVGESTATSSFPATLVLSFRGIVSATGTQLGSMVCCPYLVTQRTPEIVAFAWR